MNNRNTIIIACISMIFFLSGPGSSLFGKKTGTLAVMNFESLNVDKSMGVVISEIVRTEVTSMEDIPYTIVERVMLNKVLKEQELSMTGLIKNEEAAQVGKMLFADHLLVGKIMQAAGKIRISASIIETNTSVVKKQVIEEIPSRNDIPLGAKALSFKLFDRKFKYKKTERKHAFEGGDFTSIYTDTRGIHRGGKIFLKVNGDKVSGYTMDDIGKAEMNGTISGNFINGFYKAKYGYGNFSFKISGGGKYIIGNYYQVTNGANGDWIAEQGDSFSLPNELFTKKWNMGDHCLVKWSGDAYWYPAKIGNIKDGLYYIRYDDGDAEWRLEKYIRKENIRKGDTVFGNWKSRGKYYRGKIAQRKGDRIFIHYDDGDKEWTTISKVRLKLDVE